jgi:ABC-type multidrug transport system ATPase subunit
MIRRLELAQPLVSNPRLLVLDEPTIGLDPVGRDSVWQRVHELRRNLDMTVLVTTHYMEEADEHCDRVAIMHAGRIEAVGVPARLRAAIGPEATLEDVFRRHSGHAFEEGGDLRDVRSARRTAQRLGRAGHCGSVDRPWIASRILAFCVVELQKIRHDRSELLTRAIQPALWLLIFGKTFSSLHPVPTGGLPYLDFLTPGSSADLRGRPILVEGVRAVALQLAGTRKVLPAG